MQIVYPNSKELILAIVKKQGRINAVQMRRLVDLSDTTITDYLRYLHEENKIYIVDWYRDRRNCARPVFAYGNKMDAEKPPIKGKYVPKNKVEKKEFVPHRDEAASWMTHL